MVMFMNIENPEITENIDLHNLTAMRRTVYSYLSRGFHLEIDQAYLDLTRKISAHAERN